MEEHSIVKHENDTQMALRLMKALDYREHLSCEKKRYLLENWPENTKKRHKKLDVFTVKYVPEIDFRDKKDMTSIRTIVESSITALRRSSCDKECNFISTVHSSHDLSSRNITDMSDLDLVKMCPSLFSRLNDRSLKALLVALKGNGIICDQRHMIEYELRIELEKSMISFPLHSQQVLTMMSILRDPSSYSPPHVLADVHIKPFPSMLGVSIQEAACEAFKHIDRFPTSIIIEVCKLLITDSTYVSKRLVGIKNRKRILNLVHKEIEIFLCSFKGEHFLPMNVEKALHLLSFAARILYGDDSNLREFLKPLSPKQCSLESSYETAFLQLKNVETVDLLKIFNTIGQPFKRKKECICELQRVLISSIHYIYDGMDIPDNILKAISIINDVSDSGKRETNFTNDGAKESELPHKGAQRNKLIQRMTAEVEAVLDVSSELRSLIWESYAAFYEHGAVSKLSSTDVKHIIHEGELSSERFDKDGEGVHVKSFTVECQQQLNQLPSLKSGGLCEESLSFMHELERFSDEVASTIYILIGRLFQEISCKRSLPLRAEEVNYLLTGLESSSVQSNCRTLRTQSVTGPTFDNLILETAKSLLIIPASVQQAIDDRLNAIVEAGAVAF